MAAMPHLRHGRLRCRPFIAYVVLAVLVTGGVTGVTVGGAASPPTSATPTPRPAPTPPTPTPTPTPTRGSASPPVTPLSFLLRSLDGSRNNLSHADWGQAGSQYSRVAPPVYADGKGAMAGGPSPRRISNRIFNDDGQNLFSENGISQWGWAWGQFIDHDMDLRDERPGESAPMPYETIDPLESFGNDTGSMDFSRTPAAPGTGQTTPRQQVNTITSYLDASQVYGSAADRLQWLQAPNSPDLLLPAGYLPHANVKPGAPVMDLMGRLAGNPSGAIVAGDVRANENLALTSLQTLFAREHNRIADSLPAALGNELRFQIARRVVGAEIQYITYNEFLPTLGVQLDRYRGYDPRVNAAISNEFATVGFRAHSMVHGEFEPNVPASAFSPEQLDGFTHQGATVEHEDDGSVTIVFPLAATFGNPDVVQQIGLGPALGSLSEREYANDEQIDNSMRSILFQVPRPGTADPAACGEPVVDPDCFADVADLGADDVQRGRDHGMPSYNQLRRAYGLAPARSFAEITGEPGDALPAGMTCDSPESLAFTQLRDAAGNAVAAGDQESASFGVRGSTLAARLKCLYPNVDAVDGFVGMVSERHVPHTEFGPLQLAIWKRQFAALRDGDRFFYAIDPALALIQQRYGVDYRRTLARIVAQDAGQTTPANVFLAS